MAQGASSSKRKASDAFVPDSIASYLMGALRDNFDHLKTHIQQDCAFVSAKPNPKQFTKQLLEELFRYLYVLADSSSDGVIRSSPSYFVDQAFHCLMLDPVLYFKVCDEVLSMHNKDGDNVTMRVLPHDALGGKGEDEEPRKARYTNTLIQYKETFGENPPLALWSDYSNDPVAVRAELEAQQAQATATAPSPHPVPQSVPPQMGTQLSPTSPTPPTPKNVQLCLKGTNSNDLNMTVNYGCRFSAVVDRVRAHQRQYTKHVELTFRGMVLRNYMTPYNLNMKDRDVVDCNIPFYTDEELAANAANFSKPASAAGTSHRAGDSSTATTTITAAPRATTTATATAIAATTVATSTTDTTLTSTAATTATSTPPACTAASATTVGVDRAATVTSTNTNTTALTAPTAPTSKLAAKPSAIPNIPRTDAATHVSLALLPTSTSPAVDLGTGADKTLISFRVRDARGGMLACTMNRTVRMRHVIHALANYKGLEANELRLLYDFWRVDDQLSPQQLGMQDGEELELCYQLLGC